MDARIAASLFALAGQLSLMKTMSTTVSGKNKANHAACGFPQQAEGQDRDEFGFAVD